MAPYYVLERDMVVPLYHIVEMVVPHYYRGHSKGIG